MKYIFASLAVLLGGMQVSTPASAMNCVEYVKYATGLNLMGNAYQWWYSANNVLARGYEPAPGAIMVFDRTARMHVGHVAIVSEIVSKREILINQANWHHGRVDHGVSVIDTSSGNDWSSVEVEWSPKVYGGSFPITGFIYTNGNAAHESGEGRLIEASTAGDGLPRRGHVRMVSGSVISHGRGGHLVLADLRSGNKARFKLASLPVHEAAASHAAKKLTSCKTKPGKSTTAQHKATSVKSVAGESAL